MNKSIFSTNIVFGWMIFLAISFVVLLFSGSSKASVLQKDFPMKVESPIRTTQYAPATMKCGVVQIVRIKYTHVKRWKRYGFTTSKKASFWRPAGSSVLSYELSDPPYSASGERQFNNVSSLDPIALAFGLRLPSRFELGPGQSREIRYGFRPPC